MLWVSGRHTDLLTVTADRKHKQGGVESLPTGLWIYPGRVTGPTIASRVKTP